MKIELKTILCGPGFNAGPGDILDLHPEDASRLVKGGFAVAVKSEPMNPEKELPEVETATVEPTETAVGRRGRKPRGN